MGKNNDIYVSNKVTTISGAALDMIDNIKKAIDNIIRKNEPDCEYRIKHIYLTNENNGLHARVSVETKPNGIVLFYNLNKLDELSDIYYLRDIDSFDYFTEINTLEDAFSEAISFVKDYVNNPYEEDQECKILEFSFDTGEFLVSILDRDKYPLARVFSFEIEFNSDNEIEGFKYYGEVTSDMINK